MTHRPPLTPVPYARRTEPSRPLDKGGPYTLAVETDIRATFRRARYQLLRETPCATSSKL